MVMYLLNFAEQKYHREVLVIPVDFSRGMEIYPYLAEQLKDLDIGILGDNSCLGLHGVIIYHNMGLSTGTCIKWGFPFSYVHNS